MYLGGIVEMVDEIDPDYISYFDLKAVIMSYGYPTTSTMYYMIPSVGLTKGLRVINSDIEIREMLDVYKGLPVISLYCERGHESLQIIYPDDDVDVPPVETNVVHLDDESHKANEGNHEVVDDIPVDKGVGEDEDEEDDPDYEVDEDEDEENEDGSDVEEYVHPCYSRDTYLGVYQHMIQPIPGKHDWVKSNNEEVLPPFMRRPNGRPKKARRKAAEEAEDAGLGLFRAGRYMSCSKCLQKSHNLRSCKNPIHPNSKLLKKKNPSQSQAQQSQPKQKKSRTRITPQTSTQPSVDAGFYTKPAQLFEPINPGFYTQPSQGSANSANPGFSSQV
ncbi:hypothetical protein RHGRI_001153 [Rhododendron griersonianum]|uniref:PB1-like domain-containing protein n=1 Tax=Rhododendron griersonianum TaxID=479676 RepID=A0AAV6LKD0_9ERIC|nr:hypothetical protein RHGRI_001153 [Rhododendron griersonianum]